MFSIGDEYYTPVTHQDLMSGSMCNPMGYQMGMGMMNPMMNPMMGGMYGGYPPLLGGVQMTRPVNSDIYLATKNQKVEEDKKTGKTAGLVLLGALALGCIPILRKQYRKAGSLGQLLKNAGQGISNRFNKFLNKQPVTFQQRVKNVGNSIKNIFRKRP